LYHLIEVERRIGLAEGGMLKRRDVLIRVQLGQTPRQYLVEPQFDRMMIVHRHTMLGFQRRYGGVRPAKTGCISTVQQRRRIARVQLTGRANGGPGLGECREYDNSNNCSPGDGQPTIVEQRRRVRLLLRSSDFGGTGGAFSPTGSYHA
jgi:hypothetical protein